MGVPELHAIVVDAARPIAERERALTELRAHGARFPELSWRAAIREPLRGVLGELGLLGPTFDEDFDEAAPTRLLALDRLVLWAIESLPLRCVRVPADLRACTTAPFRAALARVAACEPVVVVTGHAQSPAAVSVTLGAARGTLGTADPGRDTGALLTAWAALAGPPRTVVMIAKRTLWLATAAQLRTAEALGLAVSRTVSRPLSAREAIDAVLPGAPVAALHDLDLTDDEADARDDRHAALHAACDLSDRISSVDIAGRRITLTIDGLRASLEMPRVRDGNVGGFITRLFEALADVLEPRLGLLPVLAVGDLVVLVTAAERDRLQAAGLLL